MAHTYVHVRKSSHECHLRSFANMDLSNEREMRRLLLLSNTVDVLPVCLPFPTFDDSENPETRLTATDLLKMVSREVTCPEFPPRYCPIKSALKGVANYALKLLPLKK